MSVEDGSSAADLNRSPALSEAETAFRLRDGVDVHHGAGSARLGPKTSALKREGVLTRSQTFRLVASSR